MPFLKDPLISAPTKKIPIFNLEVPVELPGVDPGILDPGILIQIQRSGPKKPKSWQTCLLRTLYSTLTMRRVNDL
jgi:ATP-dependent phosphoenolpyruvate carboxykinase